MSEETNSETKNVSLETPKTEVNQANLSSEASKPAIEDVTKKVADGDPLTKKEEKLFKEYKLKVNGRDKVIKFDPSNDEEVTKYLQKAEASDSKFQEAAEVRKAAMQFIEELRKNPRKVLSDPNIGVDLKKFAEEIMNETIQDLEKTPEQRELDKAKKELQDLKKQREDEKKDSESKEFTRLQAEHEKTLESSISAALDVGGLPKTPRTVKHMAEMMMIALDNNIDLTPQDIVPIIKSTTLSEFKEVMNSLTDDQLEDFTKDLMPRLRKRNVAKAKAVETANAVKSTGNETKKTIESSVKKQTIRDWLKV